MNGRALVAVSLVIVLVALSVLASTAPPLLEHYQPTRHAFPPTLSLVVSDEAQDLRGVSMSDLLEQERLRVRALLEDRLVQAHASDATDATTFQTADVELVQLESDAADEATSLPMHLWGHSVKNSGAWAQGPAVTYVCVDELLCTHAPVLTDEERTTLKISVAEGFDFTGESVAVRNPPIAPGPLGTALEVSLPTSRVVVELVPGEDFGTRTYNGTALTHNKCGDLGWSWFG